MTDSYVYSSGDGTNGSSTLTETASGTYNFKSAVNADTVNGSYAPGQWPIISFTVSGSAQCTNVTASSSYHAQIACGTYPAAAPQVPTVQAMPGVSTPTVIGTPDIVPVVFNSSAVSWTTGNQTNDVTFLQQFTASKVWGLLDQYGVGAAAVQSPVSVTNLTSTEASALLTPSGMAAYVKAQAASWDPGITSSTVFLIYLPPNQYYNRPAGTGYTGQVTVNSTTVTYSVVPDSGPVNGTYISSSTVYQYAESGLVDAVTDPNGTDGYAWMSANPDVWLGLSAAGGLVRGADTVGIGTLCSEAGSLAYPDVSVAQVLPLWSNADAGAGRNPCEPEMSLSNFDEGSVMLSSTSSVYAGVVQQTPAPVQATGTVGGVSRTDQVVTIQPGQSVNVTFTFLTTGAVSGTNASTPGIPVSAAVVGYVDSSAGAQQIENGDLNSNPSTPALLTVSAVKNLTRAGADGYALNGDTLQVTVTASSTAFSGLYVLAINVPCMYAQGPDGPNETCSSPTDYTSLPVGITEGSTWH